MQQLLLGSEEEQVPLEMGALRLQLWASIGNAPSRAFLAAWAARLPQKLESNVDPDGFGLFANIWQSDLVIEKFSQR